MQVSTPRGDLRSDLEGSLSTMTGKFFRGVLGCAAIAAAAISLSACGDSSTANSPLDQDVTTTMISGSAPESGEPSSVPPSEAAASSSAAEAASKATSTLPATKPEKPSGGQADDSKLSEKDKDYLAALKRDDVAFLGDEDNNAALTWGYYVCDAKGKKTDPAMIKIYVSAGLGPSVKSDNEAGAKADKLIAAAEKNLC